MESTIKHTLQEEKLLELLIQKTSEAIPVNWSNGLLVRSKDDGEMGGYRCFLKVAMQSAAHLENKF
jgi:hypothetical protein